MARARGGRWADRPENVEVNATAGITYFRYKFPDGRRKTIGNSADAKAAFEIARALNGHFAAKRQQIPLTDWLTPAPRAPLTSSTNPLFSALIAEYKKHDPRYKKWGADTRQVADAYLNLYRKLWGARTVKDLQTLDFSQHLNGLTNSAYIKQRRQLHQLMQFAGHQGYVQTNPLEVTILKSEGAKVRRRHTVAGFRQILESPTTPDWLKRAMRIGLYSLQRREDVVLLHRVRNGVSLDSDTITVLQRKTRNYRNPVYIQIKMGEELRAAVHDCLRSEIPCPYLIHTRPLRMTAQARAAKAHPFAVTADYLTRHFAQARDACGAYAHLPFDERPTFHEIRALGIWLYHKAGYSERYIMDLSGHATRAMYERYLRDHEQWLPKQVDAGSGVHSLLITGAQFPQNSPKIPPKGGTAP